MAFIWSCKVKLHNWKQGDFSLFIGEVYGEQEECGGIDSASVY